MLRTCSPYTTDSTPKQILGIPPYRCGIPHKPDSRPAFPHIGPPTPIYDLEALVPNPESLIVGELVPALHRA